MIRQEEIDFLMGVARLSAERSKAIRKQVGGVVTDSKGNLVASGFNGTVRGFHTNDCETKVYRKNDKEFWGTQTYPYADDVDYQDTFYRLVTDEATTVHAEQNLISHAARRGISIDGGIVALTLSPCAKCCSLLIQCGIQEIIFEEKYRSFDEIDELYGKYVKLTQYNRNI